MPSSGRAGFARASVCAAGLDAWIGRGRLSRLRAFGLFWWDFVVGDDWRVAAGLALAIAAVELLHRAHVAAWWLLPLAVAGLLYVSLRRAAS